MSKVALITGGNSGLGFEAARALAATDGWRVVMACRNQKTAGEAASRIRAESGEESVEVKSLDLSSLDDVRRLAAEVRDELPKIDALICNAGIQLTDGTSKTDDGYEVTFAVNHLAHFLLTNLLLDHIADDGRIVFVASGTHNDEIFTGMPKPRYRDFSSLAHGDIGGPDEKPGKRGRRLYSTSKLCNVLCTYELARRLDARGSAITVNAFDPGLMPGTGLARDYSALQRFAWNYVMPALRPFHPMISSARRSGRGLARLATDEALADTHGTYYLIDKPGKSSKTSHDEAEAAALWETSLELTGRLHTSSH